MEITPTKEELMRFYSSKRTFLFFDEWSFYCLLICLYSFEFPIWLLSLILFYGGSAIYTSYHNLNMIESQIIHIEQKIFILEDSIFKLYNFLFQIKDYFSMKRQSVFHKQE